MLFKSLMIGYKTVFFLDSIKMILTLEGNLAERWTEVAQGSTNNMDRDNYIIALLI